MSNFVTKYFGSTKRLVSWLAGTGIWLVLYLIEIHRGGSIDGSVGFAIGFGLCWVVLAD